MAFSKVFQWNNRKQPSVPYALGIFLDMSGNFASESMTELYYYFYYVHKSWQNSTYEIDTIRKKAFVQRKYALE